MGIPVRMQHADHGFHHAYDSAEIERMKKAGWEVEKLKAKAEPAVVEGAEVTEKPKSKGGRPPKVK